MTNVPFWIAACSAAWMGGAAYGYFNADPTAFKCYSGSGGFFDRALNSASGGEIPTDEIRRAGAALKGIPEIAQKEDAFFNKTATLVFSILTAHRVGYIVRYARSAPDCPDTCPNVTRLLGACR